MRKTCVPTVATIAATFCLAHALAALTPAAQESQDRLREAIDRIGTVHSEPTTPQERGSVATLLDEAWDVLLASPREARPLVERALSQSTNSFQVIDLAHLYLVLTEDPKQVSKVANLIMKVDPNAYPSKFFILSSGFAALECGDCRQSALKILELRDLKTTVVEHALPVDLSLGILFALGPYGDAILPQLSSALKSESCAVRRNALRAIAHILPWEAPPGIVELALEDPCKEARLMAWEALGELASPELPPAATRLVSEAGSRDHDEMVAIIDALKAATTAPALQALRHFEAVSDPDLKKRVAEALLELENGRGELLPLQDKEVPRSRKDRRSILAALSKTKRTRAFEYEAEDHTLLTNLLPEDYPAVNQARLAVLRRVSDECLYEHAQLSKVAHYLRRFHSLK